MQIPRAGQTAIILVSIPALVILQQMQHHLHAHDGSVPQALIDSPGNEAPLLGAVTVLIRIPFRHILTEDIDDVISLAMDELRRHDTRLSLHVGALSRCLRTQVKRGAPLLHNIQWTWTIAPLGDHSNTPALTLAPKAGTTIALRMSSRRTEQYQATKSEYLFTNSRRLLLVSVLSSGMPSS